METQNMPAITVVIPAFNEEESLPLLLDKVRDVLLARDPDPTKYQIIVVDDGSTDGTWRGANDWGKENEFTLRLLRFRSNRGKSAALAVAFEEANGEIVITMDADLQDDPEEINNLIAKLDEDYDLVSGWKQQRNDPASKRWPSLVFNRITSMLSGVDLQDFNCGLKAYRSDVVKELNLYGELHRYIPVLAAWRGYKVTEIPVKHHARKYGVSKFGLERYARGFFDLLSVLFLNRYRMRPLHLFGGVGIGFIGIGSLIELYFVYLWLVGVGIGQRPLFFLGILMIIVGLQAFFFGLLGDMMASNTDDKHRYITRNYGPDTQRDND